LLLYGHDAEVAEWVFENIPHLGNGDFGPCAAIGVLSKKHEIVAGVVYHDYQPDYLTIQLSMASVTPFWAKPDNIKGLLTYPFHQLGVNKIWTATPHESERVIKFNRHLGFTQEAVLAHHFGPKRHAVICRMLKPDFTRKYHG
tara:strand:+ start:3665 stop:4093 length:429 start_codon:yes stop_codon:yes gene_type:complete